MSYAFSLPSVLLYFTIGFSLCQLSSASRQDGIEEVIVLHFIYILGLGSHLTWDTLIPVA